MRRLGGRPQVSALANRVRRTAAPLSLLLLLAAVTAVIADAATPLDAPQGTLLAAKDTALTASVQDGIAVPASLEAHTPGVPRIDVIFPPPPEPPKASSGGSGSRGKTAEQRIAAAAAAGVTSPSQWCSGGYGATASASSVSGLLAAANAERARFGLGALVWSDSLASMAAGWSAKMAAASDPSSPLAALAHGDTPSPGGQNVAAYWASPAPTEGRAIANFHGGWMASKGHCANILNSGYTVMGAGVAVTADGLAYFGTVNFQ